jgi:uncharacterized membrane protein
MLNFHKMPAPLVVALLGAVPALPGAFVLAGILAGPEAGKWSVDLVNPLYFKAPLAISLHIASGILFCLLAPLQFSRRFRARAPRWHRLLGRLAMAAGLAFGLSALPPMLGPIPGQAGLLHYGGLAAGALGFCTALALSYISIRQRDIAAHRAWALRAVAIGLIGASRILLEALAWLILGDMSQITGGAVIWLAMALNLLIVERHLRSI